MSAQITFCFRKAAVPQEAALGPIGRDLMAAKPFLWRTVSGSVPELRAAGIH